MKAFLTRYTYENMADVTGDDLVFLHIFFATPQQPEIAIPHILPYDKLLRFIQTQNSSVYEYLVSIRTTIGGYGPKQGEVFRIMADEGFLLEPYVQQYVESLSEEQITKHYKGMEQTQQNTPDESQLLSSIQEELTPERIQQNQNWYPYIEEIDQALHETTLRFYPNLAEQDRAFYTTYKELLSRTSLEFARQLDKLINNHP